MSHVMAIGLTKGLVKFKDSVNYDSMAKAVYSGNYKAVNRHVPFDDLPAQLDLGFDAAATALTDASTLAAAEVAAAGFAGRGGRNAVDPKALAISPDNPKVDAYIQTRVGSLAQNMTDEMLDRIRSSVRSAREDHLHPSDVAAQIRDSIGLNDRQATALQNYKDKLRGDGTPPEQADSLASDYEGRLLDQRSMMIARTEVAYATNQGSQETWQSAQDEGLLSDTAKKVWQVDGDPCPICMALQGQAVGMDEDFETEDGDSLRGPPAHPHCRCVLILST